MDLPYQRKAEHIAVDLRTRIINGVYKKGDRLPTRAELRRRYEVTSDTLQRALNSLLDEGFVETAGRRGTFVSERAPHLTRYAVLFPNRFLPGEPKNLFNRSLYRQAIACNGRRQIQICDGFFGRAGFLEYDSLVEDVACNRLAGLIFASAPFALEDTPLLMDDGLPRTAFMSHLKYPHVPVVTFDMARLVEMAAERLAVEGRRRVAVLVDSGLSAEEAGVVRSAFQNMGLLPEHDLLIGMSIHQPQWVGQIIRLLFKAPPGQRPDAIFIGDDNLVEPVTQALRELELRVPDDIMIIGHANFPHQPTSPLPLLRIGFNINALLEACLHNVDQMRQGIEPNPITILQPTLEADQLHPEHSPGLSRVY